MLGEVFQPVLEQMKIVAHKTMGVLNNAGAVIANIDEPLDEDLAYEAVTNAESNGKMCIRDRPCH